MARLRGGVDWMKLKTSVTIAETSTPLAGCRHRLREDDGWKSGPTSKPRRSVSAAACLADLGKSRRPAIGVGWCVQCSAFQKNAAGDKHRLPDEMANDVI